MPVTWVACVKVRVPLSSTWSQKSLLPGWLSLSMSAMLNVRPVTARLNPMVTVCRLPRPDEMLVWDRASPRSPAPRPPMFDGEVCQVRFSRVPGHGAGGRAGERHDDGAGRAAGGRHRGACPRWSSCSSCTASSPSRGGTALGDVHGVVDTAKAGAATDTMVTGRVQAAPRATVRRVSGGGGRPRGGGLVVGHVPEGRGTDGPNRPKLTRFRVNLAEIHRSDRTNHPIRPPRRLRTTDPSGRPRSNGVLSRRADPLLRHIPRTEDGA